MQTGTQLILPQSELPADDNAPALPAKKNKGNIIVNVIFYMLIIAALFIAFTYASNEPRVFLRHSGFTVLTRSMQNELPQGSFILTRQYDPVEYRMGHDITFFRPSDGEVVTHRIVGIYENYTRAANGDL